jgi:hypothetical protein
MKVGFIVILGFLIHSDELIDWGVIGHRTVGQVAAQHISKKTQIAMEDLLGGASLAYISTYADEIKSDDQYKAYNPWHYVNMELDENYDSSKKNSKGDIIHAIGKCIKVLKSKTASKKDNKFYLKLLIHFIGDLHQPLHLGKKSDKGGNDIKIKWFGKISNLHRLWDSDLIDSSKLSYTELSKNLPRLSQVQQKQIASSPISVWIEETHAITKNIYKDLPKNTNLGYRYRYENFETIRLQLLKAGLRLAYVLDDIFK